MNVTIDTVYINFNDMDDIDDNNNRLDLILLNLERIMSKISDFATAAQASLDAANAALDNIAADEVNQAAQIKTLSDQIAAGASNLTPEDQALLDSLVTNSAAVATKAKSLADSIPDLPPPPAA